MAAVESTIDPKTARCVFCTSRGDIEGYKAMPCSHIFCKECITKYYEVNSVLRCPTCREVFAMEPDSLPSAHQMNQVDESILCEVCTKSGVDATAAAAALIYCMLCEKLYCVKHTMDHDALLEEHLRIGITEYKQKQNKLRKVPCDLHSELPYSMACKICMTLMCTRCISQSSTCPDGATHHELETLDELSKHLVPIEIVKEREDKLSSYYKLLSEVIDDFNTVSDSLTELLEQYCKGKVNDSLQNYHEVKEELMTSRRQTASKMSIFMEEVIGKMWCDVFAKRQKMEAKLEQTHEVEIIKGHSAMKSELEELVAEKIPSLDSIEVMTLEIKGNVRSIGKLEIAVSIGKITPEHGIYFPSPTSLRFIKTVNTSSKITSVCMYKGVTYVGVQGGVDKVDGDIVASEPFIVTEDVVLSIVAHGDNIYVLSSSHKKSDSAETAPALETDPDFSQIVSVHDISGKLVASWTLHANVGHTKQLLIVENHLVIPSKKDRKLMTYSLEGMMVNCSSCLALTEAVTDISAADNHSIIMVNQLSGVVSRVDSWTGDILWESKEVREPEGVTCYKGQFVFVSSGWWSNPLQILSLMTGMPLKKIPIDSRGHVYNGRVFDLHISGDRLIVPRYGSKQVQIYQIE